MLSPSTQLFDRTQKFEDYQKLDSLMEYLLISQDQPLVNCYRRQVDGAWELTVYQTGDRVLLTSLNLEFPISALYQGLD